MRNFEMKGPYNQVIYYLIYGTKHWKGLEAMKEAMYRVDRRGTYRFSDWTDIRQHYLIDYANEPYWIQQAAETVYEKFKGQTVSESEVHKLVITDTLFIYRKSILQYLEKCSPSKITHVTNRKRVFSYPEGCCITFCN